MGLDAGSVFATLGGEVDERGFREFDRALNRIDGSSATAKLGADAGALDREILGARKKLAELDAMKIDPEVDLDTAAFDREHATLRAKLKRLDAEKIGIRIDTKEVVTANRESSSLTSKIRDLNSGTSLLSRTMGLLKWPAMITGVGAAAQGVSSLVVGTTGLVSVLSPLSGLLAGYPAVLGAFAQATGVIAFAGVSDLTDAVGGLNEKLDRESDAFKELSPQAQRFAGTLDRMKSPLRAIQSAVQRPLFAGMNKGLKEATPLLDPLRRGLTGTAKVMGDLAERAGTLLGRKGFGEDFEKVMSGNNRLLGDLGKSGLNLANAMRFVMVAAQPLVRWMGQLSVKWTESIEGAAKAGEETGKLAGFFERTRSTAEQLFRIIGNLAGAFGDVGREALPLGEEILDYFERASARFEAFTSSAAGRNELREYFEDVRAPLFEIFKLIGDLTGGFFELGRTEGLATLIRQVRKELLPAFLDMTEATTKSFGPPLIHLLTEAGKLLTNFLGEAGPLNNMVETLGDLAGIINKIFDAIPGSASVAATLVSALGIGKLGGKLFSGAGAAAGSSIVAGAEGAVVAGGAGIAGAAAKGWKGKLLGAGKTLGAGALAVGLIQGTSAGLDAAAMGGGPKEIASDFIGSIFGERTWAEEWKEDVTEGFDALFEFTKIHAGEGGAAVREDFLKGIRLSGPEETFDSWFLNSAEWSTLTEEQQKAALKAMDALKRALRFSDRTGIQIPVTAETDPKALDRFLDGWKKNMGALKSGVLASWQDINTVFERNQQLIRTDPNLNGANAREALAKNFRAGADALDKAMKSGAIPETKKNLERLADLIRKARLADPTRKQAEAFGDEWAKGFKNAEKITRGGILRMIAEAKKLPKPMQELAAETMLGQLREYREKGKLSQDEFRSIRSTLFAEMGRMQGKADSGASSIASSILDAFRGIGDALPGIIGGIADAASDLWATISQGPSGGGGGGRGNRGFTGGLVTQNGIQRLARGGVVRGMPQRRSRAVAGQDTVPALLAPGEFVFGAQTTRRLGAANLQAVNIAGGAGPALGGLTGAPPRGGGIRSMSHELLAMLGAAVGDAGPRQGVPQRLIPAANITSQGRVPPRFAAPPPAVVGKASSAKGGGTRGGAGGQPSAGTGGRAAQTGAGGGSGQGGGSIVGGAIQGKIDAVLDAAAVEPQISEARRLRDEISDSFDRLAEHGADQAEELRSRVGDQMKILTESGSKSAAAFAAKFGERMRGMKTDVWKEAKDLRGGVIGELTEMEQRGEGRFDSMHSGITKKFRDTRTRTKEIAAGVRGDVVGELTSIPEKAGTAFDAVGDRAKSQLGAVKLADDAKRAFADPIVSAISSAQNTLASKIRQMNTAIDGAMRNLDDLAAKARSTPTKPSGRHAAGGKIPGNEQGDVYPAMLTPGEYVIRKPAVDALGEPLLDRLNRLPGFAKGGKVKPAQALVALLKGKGGKGGGKKNGNKGGKGGKGHGSKPPKGGGYIDAAASALLDPDLLEAFGAPSEYGTWQAPETDTFEGMIDSYLGTGQTAPAVSNLWVGAMSGMDSLFGSLFSAIGSGNSGAAGAAEANIFGAGGLGILGSATAALGGIGTTGSSLIAGADPNNPGSGISSTLASLWGGYDLRQAGRGALATSTNTALGMLAAGTMKPTAGEKEAIRSKQQAMKDLKKKKPKGWKEKLAALRGEVKGIKASFGDYSDPEAELNANLIAQRDALGPMGAEDLSGTASAAADSLDAAKAFRDQIGSTLSGFGSTDPSRARSDYELALDAGFGQVRDFQSGRANLMREFGSNFKGASGSPGDTSARTFGAYGQTAEGAADSSGAAGPVTVHNYFSESPPDPHIWSRNTLFELRAAI